MAISLQISALVYTRIVYTAWLIAASQGRPDSDLQALDGLSCSSVTSCVWEGARNVL